MIDGKGMSKYFSYFAAMLIHPSISNLKKILYDY